ncbi:neural cell adhesion molecule L1-like isoform X1 [Acipenser ruthenus]|uniref:neural cell adhesion molecule L1-like isoform X1 n=1 Tax=Acipenser ruthenus TaxID=7906 RepID=UPI0027418D18|nr:neural cell adhesion molecule L1-like isoform X1 [Acipenser ruthenus]
MKDYKELGGGGPRIRALVLLQVLVLFVSRTQATIQIPSDYKQENLMTPPVITEQSPRTLTVYSSDEIVLKCEATGQPQPTFRWTKDGQFFDPKADPHIVTHAGSGTFFIVSNGNSGSSFRKYHGHYRCYAANELGTAMSAEIRLNTESPPKWQKETIAPIEAEVGDSVVLPCNPPVSTVPPQIYWMNINLQHITQSPRVTQGRNGNLYFSNVEKSDTKNDYMCHARFIGARTIVQKEPIELRVRDSNSVKNRGPRILMPQGERSSYLALRGHSLELECIAEGLPTPEIVWVRREGVMPEGRASLENFNKLLRIENITESDDGEYQCTVSNQGGRERHIYIVSVEAAPYWVRQPESGLYGPGETVRLDCDVEGKPKPSIVWKINGEPLTDTDSDLRHSVKGSSLILHNAQSRDTSVFQCEANNTHGTILANAYVYVISLPAQILSPDNQLYIVAEDQAAFLDCRTFGVPRPDVTWSRDGKDSFSILEDPRFSLYTNGTLHLVSASREDSGQFSCTVNPEAENISISATLEIRNKTVIVVPPGDQRVPRGGTAEFSCKAQYDSRHFHSKQPDPMWRRDGRKIAETADSSKYVFDGHKLVIDAVEEEDEGVYTCIAASSIDSDEARGRLLVLDVPDPPVDLVLSDPQDRSVILSWTPSNDHNSPILEYVIEYSTMLNQGVWSELTRVNESETSALLNLFPFLKYRFRVIAVNELGKSGASAPSDSFETPAAAPDSNPTGVRGEGNQTDNMVIHWEPIRQLQWCGPGFKYQVSWRQAGESEWREASTESPVFVVTGSPPFTPYHIRVRATNERGLGPEPDTVTGYSGEDLPLSSPLNVAVEFLNRTLINVTWSPVPRESVRGHLKGYKVHCWRSRSLLERPKRQSSDRFSVTVAGGRSHALLSGLQPFSVYYVEVNVFNGRGEGPASEPLRFDTPEGVPGPPASLSLDSPSESLLILQWQPPLQPNGNLTGYELHYQQISESGNSHLTDVELKPHELNWTVLDVDPRSLYRFYLKARTSAGAGPHVFTEGSALLEGALPKLDNISIISGKTFSNISWVPREGYRDVEFQIQYLNKHRSNSPWQVMEKVSSTQSFYQIQNLEPGTSYRVRFTVKNRTAEVSFWEHSIQTAGPALSELHGGFATQGWFIGLISALVLLLLILLIGCFIKRSRGGKYSVKAKEEGQVDSEARPMKDETFGEYRSLESENEEKPDSGSQASVIANLKPLGSDDSLADYGGSVDVQFNEDGSFIGQYSGKKEPGAAAGHESSGPASPVNPPATAGPLE